MKKLSVIYLTMLIPFLLKGQIIFDLGGSVNKKIYYQIGDISSTIDKGSSVTLKTIYMNKGSKGAQIFDIDKNTLFTTSISNLNNITFKPININQFWQKQALNYEVYNNISSNGIQYDLRRELELEALEFISYTENNNLIFKDGYLESYLYALAYKIYPTRIDDGRPGILNVKILKSTTPEAFIYPNGTMFLTSGLLSTINSEEELIGIMAHEISHFVLDHSIININKAEKRLKRAKFWAAFATAVAASVDTYTSLNNEYYTPGSITMGTFILASSIASELNERMGLKFSREQEMRADKCASELMKFINVNPTALSSALLKIKNNNTLNGNYSHSLSSVGSHPTIDYRVETIGKPKTDFIDSNYDKTISFVNTFNAISELNHHHLQACKDLVNRNIKSDIATEDDYILLAMVTYFMYDNNEKNNEALSYINKAKSLNISPSINMHKQEAIILIRLEKYNDAKIALNNYINSLKSESAKFEYLGNPITLSRGNSFLFNEKEWALKMINKLNKM